MNGPVLSIAIRNLRRNLLYTLIVIGGLSLSMATLLAVFQWTAWHLSYDRSYENYQQIYRFTIEEKTDNASLHTARILRGDIPNDIRKNTPFPEIEALTRLAPYRQAVIRINESSFFDDFIYACDSNFLSLFSAEILLGDRKNMLSTPYSIVLTENTARKLFGDQDPINQPVELLHQFYSRFRTYTVTGLIRDFPENSHFRINALTSLEKPDEFTSTAWVYVKLSQGCNVPALEKRIPAYISENIESDYGKIAVAHFQRISDIHLKSDKTREIRPNSSYTSVLILLTAAVLVFLLAWFNFTLLSYSQKHLAMRRFIIQWQMGASRKDFFRQNLTDNFLTGLLSLVFALLIYFTIQRTAGSFLGLDLFRNTWTARAGVLLLLIFLVISVFSTSALTTRGLYGTISRLYLNNRPSGFRESSGQTWFIRIVISLEFIITFVLLVNLAMVSRQTTFSLNRQLGSNDYTTIQIPKLPRYIVDRYDLFKEQLASYPQIKEITATMEEPSSVSQDAFQFSIDGKSFDESFLFYMPVDTNFMRFYNIPILYGEDFRSDYSMNDSVDTYILNKTAALMIDRDDPASLIGKTLKLDFYYPGYILPGRIVGISDDFKFSGPSVQQQALTLSPKAVWLYCFTVRSSGDQAKTLEILESVWKDLFPGYPFRYYFTGDLYKSLYSPQITIIRLLAVFGLLSILIAGTGLFALSGYFLDRKMYPSAIRKINGASIRDILIPELKDYFLMAVFSSLIALPLSIILVNQWIINFAEQTTIPWWLFAASILLLICFSWLAVFYHSLRLATSNPLTILRR